MEIKDFITVAAITIIGAPATASPAEVVADATYRTAAEASGACWASAPYRDTVVAIDAFHKTADAADEIDAIDQAVLAEMERFVDDTCNWRRIDESEAFEDRNERLAAEEVATENVRNGSDDPADWQRFFDAYRTGPHVDARKAVAACLDASGSERRVANYQFMLDTDDTIRGQGDFTDEMTERTQPIRTGVFGVVRAACRE